MDLQDPRKRKFRHQRDFNTDDDTTKDPKMVKKVKSEIVTQQSSVKETTNLASPQLVTPVTVLPEMLIDQKSEKQDTTTPEPSKSDQVDDIGT